MLQETPNETMYRVFPNVLHPGTSSDLFADPIDSNVMGCENEKCHILV